MFNKQPRTKHILLIIHNFKINFNNKINNTNKNLKDKNSLYNFHKIKCKVFTLILFLMLIIFIIVKMLIQILINLELLRII